MERTIAARAGVLAVVGLCALLLGGCSTAPQTFADPNVAVQTLIAAVRSGDESKMEKVLGSDAKELLSSGDEVADKNGRDDFVRLYDERHELKADGVDRMTLEVGTTAWPLPIPVVKSDRGWYFDTAAGADEMLSRRIGRNELSTIEVCLAVFEAQREYASADFSGDGWREYARQVASDPGKKNGLYWPVAEGEAQSPLGELVASATEEGYSVAKRTKSATAPYHGYYYRILTSQGPSAPGGEMDYVVQGHMIGGFGLIAWPAEYGSSGIKSFIVSHHGIVYEKDLGEDTDTIARRMKSFDPGEGWRRCEQADK